MVGPALPTMVHGMAQSKHRGVGVHRGVVVRRCVMATCTRAHCGKDHSSCRTIPPCFYISHPLLPSPHPVPHPPGTPPTSSLQPSRLRHPARAGLASLPIHSRGVELAAVGVHNLLDGRQQELDLPVLVRPGHAADQRFASAPRLLDELAAMPEKTLSPSASPGIV